VRIVRHAADGIGVASKRLSRANRSPGMNSINHPFKVLQAAGVVI
jgi:hypothetical protein